MKKTVAVCLLLVLPLCVLFSQQRREYIVFHSYAFSAFEPLQIVKPDGEDALYSAGVGSWGEEPHIDLRLIMNAPGGFAGGRLDFVYDMAAGSTPQVNNNAEIWFKPFEWLQLDLGKFQIDTLRGGIGTSDFARYLGPQGDADGMFQRFVSPGFGGALVSISPVNALFIGALVNTNIGVRYDSFLDSRYQGAETIYRNGQYALGYTFPNAGQMRIQYIGGETDSSSGKIKVVNMYGLENPFSVQAAFSYTGTPGLLAEAGVTWPLYTEDGDLAIQRPIKISLGADYTLGDFNISGRTDIGFKGRQTIRHSGGMEEQVEDFEMGLRLSGSYGFSPGRLGADFLSYYKTVTKSDYGAPYENEQLHLGVAVWGHKRFGSASLKVGCALALPTKWQKDPANSRKTINAPLVFTIPILVSFYI